jgi:hypothetical protein
MRALIDAPPSAVCLIVQKMIFFVLLVHSTRMGCKNSRVAYMLIILIKGLCKHTTHIVSTQIR